MRSKVGAARSINPVRFASTITPAVPMNSTPRRRATRRAAKSSRIIIALSPSASAAAALGENRSGDWCRGGATAPHHPAADRGHVKSRSASRRTAAKSGRSLRPLQRPADRLMTDAHLSNDSLRKALPKALRAAALISKGLWKFHFYNWDRTISREELQLPASPFERLDCADFSLRDQL